MNEEDKIIRKAETILRRRVRRSDPITSPHQTRQWLGVHLADKENEQFGCMFLTAQHHVICMETLFYGTIDGTSVHPRVIVKRALQVNAAAVVCYHNHPSGVAEPSQADVRITERLRSALAMVDIRVLDHLVVGGMDITSMAERGLF